MKSFLSDTQRDRLGWLCDKDGFVDRVEHIAGWHSLFLHSPGIQIEMPNTFTRIWANGHSKPHQVEKEIQRTINLLEKLSLDTILHIARNYPYKENEALLSWYSNILSALKQPYVRIKKTRNPNRDQLVDDIEDLVNEFSIHPSSYVKGELVKIIEIICFAADAPYNPHELAKDVKKRIGG